METRPIHRKSNSFLLDSVNLSLRLVNDILESIDQIKIGQGQDFHWNFQMATLSTDISRFVEITTLSSKLILGDNKKIMGFIRGSHTHLLFIMKGINQAQAKGDLIALEELIKYELKDNLTQWKIDLIPQLKRLLEPSTSALTPT